MVGLTEVVVSLLVCLPPGMLDGVSAGRSWVQAVAVGTVSCRDTVGTALAPCVVRTGKLTHPQTESPRGK